SARISSASMYWRRNCRTDPHPVRGRLLVPGRAAPVDAGPPRRAAAAPESDQADSREPPVAQQ
ncbi:hypothetical protein, partial [Burkholderia ubonensis]|uniref:hypothetical protein n=1 Tax=Burkholderia ubonensis TaxID=101571 RepID=UPI001E3BE4ED